MKYTAAVITVSDKGARGERKDTSGPAVRAMLEEAGFSRPQVFGGLPLRRVDGGEDRLFFLSGGV